MTGKRPLLIGIGIGLIMSSMLLAIISVSGSFEPAAAQKAQETQGTQGTQGAQGAQGAQRIQETQETQEDPPKSGTELVSDTLNDEVNSKLTVTITVPPGSTAQNIAEIMLSQELITEEQVFLDRVKERKVAGKFKAGEFELEKNRDVDTLIDRLLELP